MFLEAAPSPYDRQALELMSHLKHGIFDGRYCTEFNQGHVLKPLAGQVSGKLPDAEGNRCAIND